MEAWEEEGRGALTDLGDATGTMASKDSEEVI